MMMAGGQYTTCDDHEHPHVYLKMTKAKVKPGEYIAAGPAYMVVGEVPLPLAIPFGFFPISKSYSSGLIIPNFGDDYTRGLSLTNGGYYFAINDYMDLQVLGDIYTKGTWAVRAQSKYIWRYHFSGNINISYRNDVTGEKGMPDYSSVRNFQLQWTHSQDAKFNPYSTFSASVNFATSGYSRSNINGYYNAALQEQFYQLPAAFPRQPMVAIRFSQPHPADQRLYHHPHSTRTGGQHEQRISLQRAEKENPGEERQDSWQGAVVREDQDQLLHERTYSYQKRY